MGPVSISAKMRANTPPTARDEASRPSVVRMPVPYSARFWGSKMTSQLHQSCPRLVPRLKRSLSLRSSTSDKVV